MVKIIGNTTATPNPRPDWEQADESKADFIKNKPYIPMVDSTYNPASENAQSGAAVAQLELALREEMHSEFVLNGFSKGMDFVSFENGTCYLSGIGTCADTDVIIPSMNGADKVIGIDGGAFQDCQSLTSVVIPDSITSIGDYAFSGCYGLTSVIIPDSVTWIGDNAFEGCDGLTCVAIPDSVTNIKAGAFSGCTSLTFYCETPEKPERWDENWNPDNCPVVWGFANDFFGVHNRFASYDAKVTLNPEGKVEIPQRSAKGEIRCLVPKDDEGHYNPNTNTVINNEYFINVLRGYAEKSVEGVIECNVPASPTDTTVVNKKYVADADKVISDKVDILNGTETQGGSVKKAVADAMAEVKANYALTTDIPDVSKFITKIPSEYITDTELSAYDSALKIHISSEIAKAQLSGGEVDLSAYYNKNETYSKDEINSLVQNSLELTLNEDGTYTVAGIGSYQGTNIIIPTHTPSGETITAIAAEAFANNENITSITVPDSVTTIGDNAFYGCKNIVFYCEADEQPEGWDDGWNANRPVVWGFASDFIEVNNKINGANNAIETKADNMKVADEKRKVKYESKRVYNEDLFKALKGQNRVYVESSNYGGVYPVIGMTLDGDERIFNPWGFSTLEEMFTAQRWSLDDTTITEATTANPAGWYKVMYDTEGNPVSYHPTLGTVAKRFNDGNLRVPLTPRLDVDATSKAYVDTADTAISQEINSLKLHLGIKEEQIQYNYDLAFTLVQPSNGKAYYVVAGLGNCNATSINIPPEVDGIPVTQISADAFSEVTSITSVTIPSTVKTIGARAFNRCRNLTSVIIPKGVTSIGERAFYYCMSLKEIVIPNSVTFLDCSAFFYCSSLKYAIISANITALKGYVFAYCKQLTSVIIPSKVTSINDHAFAYCANLRSVVIPRSVTTIHSAAFNGFSSALTVYTNLSISSSADRPTGWNISGFQIIGNCLDWGVTDSDFTWVEHQDGTHDILGYVGTKTDIEIPRMINHKSDLAIQKYAFYNNTDLRSVIIPDNITSIAAQAFVGCYNLTIYCEAESKPAGWDINWNLNKYPVVWSFADDFREVNQKIDVVERIAKGRATGYVFDTVADLDSWLTDTENTKKLVLGDNFYIRALDVPDYWWDGQNKQLLETQKVDLSEYAKTSDIPSMSDIEPIILGEWHNVEEAGISDGNMQEYRYRIIDSGIYEAYAYGYNISGGFISIHNTIAYDKEAISLNFSSENTTYISREHSLIDDMNVICCRLSFWTRSSLPYVFKVRKIRDL